MLKIDEMTVAEQSLREPAGIALQVRNRAFAGKHGGRIVKLEGSKTSAANALAVLLSILSGCTEVQDWSARQDVPVWGYADPQEEVRSCLERAFSDLIGL